MASNLAVFDAEGTAFVLHDPDLSTVRDTLPGHSYEPVVLALLGQLLREPGVIFADIGALYGFFTVWAALHAPDATVVAFEPESSYVEVLRRNLAINGRPDVRIEEVALVDETGTFAFSTKTIPPPANVTGSRGYLRAIWRSISSPENLSDQVEPIVAHSSQSTVGFLPFFAATLAHSIRVKLWPRAVDQLHEVRGITFDEWCEGTGIRPTVIKVDVHGAEGMVLGGMKQALASHVKHVLLELHTRDLLVKYDHAAILRMLLDAGFELYELKRFRSSKGWLEPIRDCDLERVADQKNWSPVDLYFMKFFYGRRNTSS